MLPDGEKIRQHLSGMGFIGEAVPYRDACVRGQFLHDFLTEAAVFDAIKQAAQHPGGVGNTLLFPDLGAGGIQICDADAQIAGGNLKAAPGARAGLFENQGDVFAAKSVVGDAVLFFLFQACRQVEKITDFFGCEIQNL